MLLIYYNCSLEINILIKRLLTIKIWSQSKKKIVNITLQLKNETTVFADQTLDINRISPVIIKNYC